MSALTTLGDGAIVARRNLIKIKRVPELLVFTTLSPIMFVIMFAYVFGGAISGGDPQLYREFLMAGIFAQTVVFGATITGAGWPRTCRRASSTASVRCRWRHRRCSRVEPCPMSSTT